MSPLRLVLAIALAALITAVPIASAEVARPPGDLWSEFPLEPTPTTEAPRTSAPPAPAPGRLTPPSPRLDPSVAVPGAGGVATSDEMSSRLLLTALIVATGVGALAFLTIRRRLVVWDAASTESALSRSRSGTRGLVVSLSTVAERAGLRPPPQELRRFSFGIDPHTAGLGPLAIHRIGLVRQEFVAKAARTDQGERRIASSRPFWRFRAGAERKAWGDLIEDLTFAGWEVVPAWGAQPGDPIRADDAWYEIQLVRADRHAVVDVTPESTREPADAG